MRDMQPLNVIAVSEIFAEGQRVTELHLHYHTKLADSSLSLETFKVFPSPVRELYKKSEGAGDTIVLCLSRTDERLLTIHHTSTEDGERVERFLPKISIQQVAPIETIDGDVLSPDNITLSISEERQLLADNFSLNHFKGITDTSFLDYSLYVPPSYDANKKYPLVVFIHDRGVCSTTHHLGVVQGLGGVVWLKEQPECFVLVPHFRRAIVNDEFAATDELDLIKAIIDSIRVTYTIDPRRFYGTGQSMGCMALMEMGIRYPTMFAGLLLVAGQWDPSRIDAVKDVPIWALVAEDDSRAFKGMSSCMEALETAGVEIIRSWWNGRDSLHQLEKQATSLSQEDASCYFTVFKGSSVVPESQCSDTTLPVMFANHMATWKLVYQIRPLIHWLLSQKQEEGIQR